MANKMKCIKYFGIPNTSLYVMFSISMFVSEPVTADEAIRGGDSSKHPIPTDVSEQPGPYIGNIPPPVLSEVKKVPLRHIDNAYSRKGTLHPRNEKIQRHDLTGEQLVKFEHVVISDTSIGVNFTKGPERCHGSRAVLVEKEDSIGIAVVAGNVPDGPKGCILLATTAHLILHTKKPIGNRKIIHLLDVDLKP